MATPPISDLHHPAARTQSLSLDSACNVETTKLTFEAARLRALSLQMEFAAAKAEFNPKGEREPKRALALYLNPQFNTWSDEFTDPVDRAILKAMRDRLDGATHEYNEAWEYISGAVDRLPCACGPVHDKDNRQCPGKVTASADTVKRRVRRWAKHGVAHIEANNNRTREGNGGQMFSTPGRGGNQAGTDNPNTITLNLGVVLKVRDGWDEATQKRAKQEWAEPWDAQTISGKYRAKLDGDAEQTKLQGSSTPLAGVKPGSSTPIPLTLNDSNPRTSREDPTRGNTGKLLEVEVDPGQVKGQSGRSAQPGGTRQWDKNPGDRNTVTFWQASKGNQVWTHDKPRPKRMPDDAKTVTLTSGESSWMWSRWPKGRPPEQVQFLQMFPSMRARMIESAEQDDERQAERRAAMRADMARFDPSAILRNAHRDMLLSAGVTAEEIDQRIAGEWADLDKSGLSYRMKVWAQAVQSTNADNKN